MRMALALNNLKRVDMPLNKENNQTTEVRKLRETLWENKHRNYLLFSYAGISILLNTA